MKEVLEELKPEKRIYVVAEKFLKQLRATGVKFELGGSVAKKTNLKSSSDIDIFARFKNDRDASNRLYEIIKKFNPERIHGSRDYYQINYEGYCIELVPVKDIIDSKKANNVTDMSPLHVYWANKHLNNKLRDDIRLGKQFCKAQKIYGAESHIKGFSGHVIDILTIYYGGFLELLKQASIWGDKVIIDIEKHGTLNKLNKSKTQSPLIVIDPIQTDRNAAAGLGREAFDKFKKAAKKYLETKDKEMFKIKDLDEKQFKKKHKHVIILNYELKKGKDDIIGSKLLQAINYIKKNTEEFVPLETEWNFNKALIAYKENKVPKKILIRGPPTSKKVDVKKFEEAHKKTFIEEQRVFAEEQREFTKLKDKIKFLIKEKYVKARVVKIKC